jgi:hypothetical protein
MTLTLAEIQEKQRAYFTSEKAKNPAIWCSPEEYDELIDEYIGGETKCLYRTPNDEKCAVGCLIPDKLYQQKFDEADGTSVDGLSSEVLDYLGRENLPYLRATQQIHDDVALSEIVAGDEHFGTAFLARVDEVRNLRPDFFTAGGPSLFDIGLSFR